MTSNTMLKIGELAELAGISRDALRFYEKHGLLTPTARTDSGYRLYSKSDVLRIRSVSYTHLTLPTSDLV